MLHRNILSLIFILNIAGCSSGGGDSETSSGGSVNQESFVTSDEVKSLYPGLDLKSFKTFCESSTTDDLVGCYISEVCSTDDGSSRLLVTSFSSDGWIRSKILWFIDNPSCSSNFMTVGLSALNLTYSTGDNVLSSSGLSVTEIDAEHTISAGGLGQFVTEYVSSFYLDNDRICFPNSDYSWDSSAAGLFFHSEKGEERPTDINFDDCMVRLN